MVNEICSVCGAKWDNRVQTHRRGTDCIDVVGANTQRLILDLEAFKKKLESVDGRVIALASVAQSHLSQIENLLVKLEALERKLLDLRVPQKKS